MIRSLEGNLGISGLDNSTEEGEGTVIKLHGNTLQGIDSMGELEELEDDGLVLAQQLTAGNTEDSGITLLFSY